MSFELFSPDEQALLAPFVTNIDRPVFGLRNLPEVVKGALFSRYSRSAKSLRRILLDEFMHADQADFARLVGTDAHAQIVATRQAEAFYDRVLIGYGDDSVAELGGAHVAVERISNIAAKALEDSRLGIDPLEKSTRYVAFNEKINGDYAYYREPRIMASPHAATYVAALDGLFETYTTLLDPLLAWIRAQSPRDAQTSERAYASATRAKALDLLRGLLPMATLTNVGLFGNGRAFEYLLTKLAANGLTELDELASTLQSELDALIPSFVKRPKTPRGAQARSYLQEIRAAAAARAAALPAMDATTPAQPVTLVHYDPEAELKVAAALLYPHAAVPLADLQAYVADLSPAERAALIADGVGNRASRFNKPGRAFEEAVYAFDLLADIGAYRDLQRHRILTQERQAYTVAHGYEIPAELVAAGLDAPYRAALDAAAAAVNAISADLPTEAQYAVPFAFRIRWRFTLNLREAYHLIELRAAPQGHPSYRAIAQAMHREIARVHPALAAGMRFVDHDTYALERLDAERRLDAKAKPYEA